MTKPVSTPSKTRAIPRNSIQYPYVVQPLSGGWEVLFVDTTHPRRIAQFDQGERALAYVLRRNRHWRLEQDALLETRALIYGIQKRLDNQTKGGLRWVGFEQLSKVLRRFWSIGCD